ncbi:MAG: helix-turn-helix domain-containing protein [Bacteroidota bacterium]
MGKRIDNSTPNYDISSILELGDSHKDFHIGEPAFGAALITPHRSTYYCILFLTKGSIHHVTNLQDDLIESGSMAFTSPGMINWWHSGDNKLEGYSILFTRDFFRQGANDIVDLSRFPFFQWDAQHKIELNYNQQQEIQSLLKRMKKEYDEKRLKNHSVLQSYLNILLIELERQYTDVVSTQSIDLPKSTRLANEYKCMVSNQFKHKKSVKEYADVLNVTANHLNDTVKSVTGQTAGSLIQEMILLEAKIQLHQTEYTIAQISYNLNFKDPSYFGRFFRKHTGMTPQQFRSAKGEGAIS